MDDVRPDLNAVASVSEFRAWYWLKEELASFCWARGLGASGSKHALSARIESWLSGAALCPQNKETRKSGAMPETFEPTPPPAPRVTSEKGD